MLSETLTHALGASLISATKKTFPVSFLKNALGKQDFSKGENPDIAAATPPRYLTQLLYIYTQKQEVAIVHFPVLQSG